MVQLMLCCGLILLICITSSKVLYKFGVPLLLIFIFLGMIFGIIGIDFSDFQLTGEIASIALVFIMFYGGFGTNWSMARPKAVPSILMSTLGTIITFFITGLFVYLIFKISLLESLLIGAVVSSTDAASVFTILRSQKLNLEGSLASLLEVESGSNDPVAYMLTLIILTIMGNGTVMQLIPMIVSQIVFGIIVGALIAIASIYLIRHANFEIESFYIIFIIAIAIISYSLSEWMGGNGYLSVYISGIIIGNSKIPHKKTLVHFLDGVSWIMQIILFFILGLLSSPIELPKVIGKSVVISFVIIFIARPISVFLVLRRFDFNTREKLFISWVGLRGAASIVFSIFALNYEVNINNDIYHIIFFMFTLLAICLNIYIAYHSQGIILTKEGKEEQLKLVELKNYINDYSLIRNRDLKSVIIWDKYLAYATAFGIPNKITNSIYEKWYNLNINLQVVEKILS